MTTRQPLPHNTQDVHKEDLPSSVFNGISFSSLSNEHSFRFSSAGPAAPKTAAGGLLNQTPTQKPVPSPHPYSSLCPLHSSTWLQQCSDNPNARLPLPNFLSMPGLMEGIKEMTWYVHTHSPLCH